MELATYLKSVGHLFAKSELSEQRRFIQEVFTQLVVDGEQLAELHPKPQYMDFFVADRYERFGGDMCVIWLPGLVPQSVLRAVFQVQLTSLVRLAGSATRARLRAGTEAVAVEWWHLIDSGAVRNRADLARREGVTRAAVTRRLGAAQSAV